MRSQAIMSEMSMALAAPAALAVPDEDVVGAEPYDDTDVWAFAHTSVFIEPEDTDATGDAGNSVFLMTVGVCNVA